MLQDACLLSTAYNWGSRWECRAAMVEAGVRFRESDCSTADSRRSEAEDGEGYVRVTSAAALTGAPVV